MDRILNALAEAMIPPGGAFDPGGADIGLPARVKEIARRLGYPSWPLGVFLRLFDWFPLLFGFRFRRFSRLDPDSRRTFLACLEGSRGMVGTGVFLALKALVMPLFYSDPEVGRRIGYSAAGGELPAALGGGEP
ncbi:MAG: hypothetical protein HYY13_12345 [Nitrospirae bacterium]|nr:hypothetical protein [Nitrospirota bacterium]